jgi:hypothetical protein
VKAVSLANRIGGLIFDLSEFDKLPRSGLSRNDHRERQSDGMEVGASRITLFEQVSNFFLWIPHVQSIYQVKTDDVVV